ncbi:MAG: TldD/PmbA family protein [Planctomycetota bacterium]|nr:TldD/PmbA family protein [Planctomycetota bacterium]
MKDLALYGVDCAKKYGASYADIRIIHAKNEGISIRNGQVGGIDRSETLGFGIRVIVDGAWGFAASSRVEKKEIEKTAKLACDTARASASLKLKSVKLADEPVYDEKWQTPYIIDPFKVPLEEKLSLLSKIDEVLRKSDKIKVAHSWMDFFYEHQYLAISSGTFIDQTLMRSAAGYSATAVDKGEVQRRSYPSSHGGIAKTAGYEIIRGSDLLENAERIRDEAVALLTAEPCPSGQYDTIIDGTQLALQIHESCGHAAELDRVLGSEANYAGTSFLTLDKLNKLKYGSKIVNLVIDGTIPGGLATVGFDDEGVRAGRYYLVKNGLFVGYKTNRELAHIVGEKRSRGCCRADGYSNLPMIRQNNLSLLPGDWDFNALLEDTPGGVYMVNNKSWSIDQQRQNFQFGCEIAYEILPGGKLGKIYKNPTYQSNTVQFWNSCDAICNEDWWRLWGVLNCGKGQPPQTAEMSHGAAPARFRKLTIGIAR